MPDGPQPLSRFRRFVTTDMDEARVEVARVYCDHRLASRGSGPLHAWRNAPRLGPVTLGAMDYGAGIAPRPLNDVQFVMVPYPLSKRLGG